LSAPKIDYRDILDGAWRKFATVRHLIELTDGQQAAARECYFAGAFAVYVALVQTSEHEQAGIAMLEAMRNELIENGYGPALVRAMRGANEQRN